MRSKEGKNERGEGRELELEFARFRCFVFRSVSFLNEGGVDWLPG